MTFVAPMSPTRADILAAIEREPAGITSAGLAAKLHTTRYRVSGVLSKLAAYGHIDKNGLAGRSGTCIWSRKEVHKEARP